MSGGSYDYAFRHVEDFAAAMRQEGGCGDYSDRAHRELFRAHVRKVAAAMRAVEWNDSGDGASDECRLIRECLAADRLPEMMREALLEEVKRTEQALASARAMLERVDP